MTQMRDDWMSTKQWEAMPRFGGCDISKVGVPGNQIDLRGDGRAKMMVVMADMNGQKLFTIQKQKMLAREREKV